MYANIYKKNFPTNTTNVLYFAWMNKCAHIWMLIMRRCGRFPFFYHSNLKFFECIRLVILLQFIILLKTPFALILMKIFFSSFVQHPLAEFTNTFLLQYIRIFLHHFHSALFIFTKSDFRLHSKTFSRNRKKSITWFFTQNVKLQTPNSKLMSIVHKLIIMPNGT